MQQPQSILAFLSLLISGLCALSACGNPIIPLRPNTTSTTPLQSNVATKMPTVTRETLVNGLEIYLLEDHHSPLVSLQVWYRVGSSYEQPQLAQRDHGSTGLAHLFEHLMFRGTAAYPDPSESLSTLGAEVNAFTGYDQTVYASTLPARHLEAAIALEADRMAHLRVDLPALERERGVVASELQMRAASSPQTDAEVMLRRAAWSQHPYGWLAGGRLSDVHALRVEDARRFRETYYQPDNAVLIIVGDFDSAQAMRWITREFGGLASPGRVRDLPTKIIPGKSQEAAERLLGAYTTRRVMWAWPAPALGDPDARTLELIDILLNGGRSTRLQQALVHHPRPSFSVLESSLRPSPMEDLYVWTGDLAPGQSTRQALERVDQELMRLGRDGPGPEELTRACTTLASQQVRATLSLSERALAIGYGVLAAQDPLALLTRPRRCHEVSVADIQRVARERLSPQKRTVVRVVDTGRVVALSQHFRRASPKPLPKTLDRLVHESAELLVQRFALNDARHRLGAGRVALEQLEERLRRFNSKPHDAAQRERLQQWLSKSPRRPTMVRKQLSSQQDLLAERVQDYEDRRAGLERALRRTPAQHARTWPWHHAFARACVARGRRIPLRDTPELTEQQGLGDAALSLGYRALMSWVFDAFERHEKATTLRRQVLSVTPEVLSRTGPDAPLNPSLLLEAAWDSAFDTRRPGRKAP